LVLVELEAPPFQHHGQVETILYLTLHLRAHLQAVLLRMAAVEALEQAVRTHPLMLVSLAEVAVVVAVIVVLDHFLDTLVYQVKVMLEVQFQHIQGQVLLLEVVGLEL
jgi:hypothetical protein